MKRRGIGYAAMGVVAVAIAGAAVAIAQQSGSEPVLHEYVEAPAGSGRIVDASHASTPKVIGAPPTAGQNPTAIRDQGKLLPEPPGTKDRQPNEPLLGQHGFAADRETEARPDRDTGADSTLHYDEPFNPAVIPFKRMSALDAVDDAYMMTVYDQSMYEVPVGGDTKAERDLFWGSLAITLTPGEMIPIPSVAPDMRVLSYETTPPIDLLFKKDGADNYYVRTDDTRAHGEYRLVFLVDAPASYFASPMPKGYTIANAASLAEESKLARPLPPRARATAERVLAQLDINRDMDFDEAVNKLVSYFRSFQAGPTPPNTGDIYWDLFLSQTGVCRHRSFAFVITAEALGIPARYVTNEAHAFAEIYVPITGWVRVDLGGAALEVDVTGAQDKTMYRPRQADAFPKPKPYAENYTRMNGDVRGLSNDQKADLQHPLDASDDPNAPYDPNALPSSPHDPGSTDPVSPAPGPGLPKIPASAYKDKSASEIYVEEVDPVAFRGEAVKVRGRAVSDGKPLAGVGVDIYFAPAGFGGDHARMLASVLTDADGNYTVDLELPRDLPLERYEVFAATPGDTLHAPAVSQ